MNMIKKKQTYRCREQTSGYQLVQGGQDGDGGVGSTNYLLGVRQATRMYCTTWEYSQFSNNCKWSIIFKNSIRKKIVNHQILGVPIVAQG